MEALSEIVHGENRDAERDVAAVQVFLEAERHNRCLARLDALRSANPFPPTFPAARYLRVE
jgi:hypothetical protein